MAYNFDTKLHEGRYTIEVDRQAAYGYFEHDELGDESGGGLWFEKAGNDLNLTDYDGVGVLPTPVVNGLRKAGFLVGEDFE